MRTFRPIRLRRLSLTAAGAVASSLLTVIAAAGPAAADTTDPVPTGEVATTATAAADGTSIPTVDPASDPTSGPTADLSTDPTTTAITAPATPPVTDTVPPSISAADPHPWRLTVYYTAVERYHHARPVSVHGCPRLDCAHGRAFLGRYPRDFVRAVHDEGTGRITSGPHRGHYLEWSWGVGYWLDSVPRDSYGHRLRPFRSAAADPQVLHRGTEFAVTRCGHDTGSGDALDRHACARLRAATWRVRDEFTPGLGGSHHVDLYIGAEHRAHFTRVSPLYLDASGARMTLRRTPVRTAGAAASQPTTATTAAAADGTGTSAAAATPAGVDDDFSAYSPDVEWAPGTVHGPWNVVWNGYGRVAPAAVDGTHALRLTAGTATAPGETHSALVTSGAALGDLDASWTYRTAAQLRTGSTPNVWEVGWVLWHYTDNTHFYYVLLKPDGWELGKEDPAYPGNQRFLATGPGSFPVGATYTVHVQQQGAAISVDVDGQPLVSFTDTERPYLSGSVAMYDEDSTVDFLHVAARAL